MSPYPPLVILSLWIVANSGSLFFIFGFIVVIRCVSSKILLRMPLIFIWGILKSMGIGLGGMRAVSQCQRGRRECHRWKWEVNCQLSGAIWRVLVDTVGH